MDPFNIVSFQIQPFSTSMRNMEKGAPSVHAFHFGANHPTNHEPKRFDADDELPSRPFFAKGEVRKNGFFGEVEA